jgi:hypothetical protein
VQRNLRQSRQHLDRDSRRRVSRADAGGAAERLQVAAVSSFRSSVVRLGPGQFDGHVGVGQRVRQHRSRARELGFEVTEQAADLCE